MTNKKGLKELKLVDRTRKMSEKMIKGLNY